MRAEWWSAIFGAAIFLRMVLCAVCMCRSTDHFVRLAMLGVLIAGLGLMLAPWYAVLEVPVDLLLASSVAIYLYTDKRVLGPCGTTCPPEDIGSVVACLDRWRRPVASLLIACAVAAIFVTSHAQAAEEPEYIIVSRVQLERLIAYTDALIDEVARLRTVTGCS